MQPYFVEVQASLHLHPDNKCLQMDQKIALSWWACLLQGIFMIDVISQKSVSFSEIPFEMEGQDSQFTF